jgi:hypothetical protein
MANPISPEIRTGTIGELLVQLRLLQFHVQAAPPLKDSGNDLIACYGEVIKTIQVKTTTTSNQNPPTKPNIRKKYNILAIVRLSGYDETILLDKSKIYLIPKRELKSVNYSWEGLEIYLLNSSLVRKLFDKSSFYKSLKRTR